MRKVVTVSFSTSPDIETRLNEQSKKLGISRSVLITRIITNNISNIEKYGLYMKGECE